MKHKKKVTEKLKFDIPKNIENRYKPDITFGDLKNVKELEDNDVIDLIKYEEREASMWGMGNEDDPETYFVPVVTVIRTRWETDEEFNERLIRDGKIEKQQRDKEYQEYLRLKGIFEN